MKKFLKQIAFGLIFCTICGMWSASAQKPAALSGISPEQQKRLDMMKAKGTDASMTVFPVRLGGKPFDRVSEVIGLLLERQGLKTVEMGQNAFDAGNKTTMDQMTASFGDFIKKNPVATDYALYAEFNGTQQTGLDELRAVVVDKSGLIVWSDCQTARDETIKKMEMKEPMTFSVLLAERLSPFLNLDDETAKAAKSGKMARLMEERSGLPPEEELSPLAERQKILKKTGKKATLVVFPARIGGTEADIANAADICESITEAGLFAASPAKRTASLPAAQAGPNELKRLWDMARAFREYVKKNPSDADYVLYADYAFNPDNWEQGMVHYVVCDRNGEWVIVDMRNSHHPDYRNIKPVSSDDCVKLIVKSLKGYM